MSDFSLTKEKLKKELQEIEQEQQRIQLEKEKEEKQQHVGYAYVSHNISSYFTRGKKSFNFYGSRVKGVIIEDNQVWYVADIFRVFKNGGNLEMEIKRDQKSKSVCPYTGVKYKSITRSNFEELIQTLQETLESDLDDLRHQYKAGLLISCGDHHDEEKKTKHLKTLGRRFITVEGKVFEILRWEGHPYLYNNEFLYCKESFDIVSIIVKELKDNANMWGGKIANRDLERARLLEQFTDKNWKNNA